jgi:ketosteroid isomerase-like protein
VSLAGGCGAADEREQVRGVVEAFGDATRSGDYDRICETLFDPALVRRVDAAGVRCAQLLQQGFGQVENPTLTLGRITVDGDRASARVTSGAEGQPPSTDTLRLRRVGGTWRISSLGR